MQTTTPRTLEKIGEFTATKGFLVHAVDPCVSGSGLTFKVCGGDFIVEAEKAPCDWGIRSHRLLLTLKGLDPLPISAGERIEGMVNVDGGSAGFARGEVDSDYFDDEPYDNCFSVIAGYGDGGYPMMVEKDADGLVRRAAIYFIYEDSEVPYTAREIEWNKRDEWQTGAEEFCKTLVGKPLDEAIAAFSAKYPEHVNDRFDAGAWLFEFDAITYEVWQAIKKDPASIR